MKSGFEIILVIIQFDRLLSPMSNHHQPSRPKKNGKKHQKHDSDNQNEVSVRRAIENLQYPAHLSQTNYLSISNLQGNIEDALTHQVYYQVIMENQDHFAGKTVLHITEGINCLYSIFAARAGATKVYCVILEKGEREKQSVQMMKQIIKENRLQDTIEVLLWKDFNANIDAIIAQPMGYCLHFDGLLELVILARDRFLKKGGPIFPNTLSFKCAAIHDEYFSDCKVDFWDDVYGIPMKSMKKWISNQPLIRAVDPALIVSKATNMMTFNLEEIKVSEIKSIEKTFEVELLGACNANGLVCWFEVVFGNISEKKEIKGNPWLECTRYSQATLYWPQILQFDAGKKLRVRLKGQRLENKNFTILSTQFDNQKYQYTFS